MLSLHELRVTFTRIHVRPYHRREIAGHIAQRSAVKKTARVVGLQRNTQGASESPSVRSLNHLTVTFNRPVSD